MDQVMEPKGMFGDAAFDLRWGRWARHDARRRAQLAGNPGRADVVRSMGTVLARDAVARLRRVRG